MKKHSQKTVLLVAPYFPPHTGGLERYAFEIAQRLKNIHGWRVVVVTSGDRGGLDTKEEFHGLTVYRLEYQMKISNTPFSFAWVRKLRKIIKVERPDIINIHNPVAGLGDLASLLAGKIPTVVAYHAGSMHKGRLLPDILIWGYECLFMGFMLRKAKRIACSSDFVRFDFLKKYIYKSSTISPAVDITQFTPNPELKSVNPTILFVAGLGKADQHKGLETLFAAMPRIREAIPNIQLSVVGDGDMRGTYVERARELGLSSVTTFSGRLSGQPLTEAYQRATLFILPTANDSYSMVIIEAMASGLPVISTTVGSIPDIIEDGKTGYIVSPNDAGAIAEKAIKILGDTELMEAMGNAGHQRVKNGFTWEERAQQYDNMFSLYAHTEGVTKKKRIVVAAPYYYPKIGGLEFYARSVARGMQESGEYEVTIVTTNHESKGYRQEKIDGMTVHRLPIWFKLSNTPINPMWYFWLKRIYRLEKPDIIHTHAPVPFMADVAAFAAGHVPVVLTYHAGSMRKGRFFVDLIIGLYEHTFLRALFVEADAIVAVSRSFAASSMKRYKNKTSCIFPSVELADFTPSPLPLNEKKVVTYVGRIEHNSAWKGIEPLLLAIALVHKTHPDIELRLVGGGDAILHYTQRAKELGIAEAVKFVGVKMGAALAAAYTDSTLVVLPSTSASESFGTVLIEAMAVGRPVIGSDIGGIPQVITNEVDGLLVEANNPTLLAAAILRIATDHAYASRLGAAGLLKVRSTFSRDIQVANYRKLFSEVEKASTPIVQIAAYYPPNLGGLERVAKMCAEGLAKDGYNVRVITTTQSGLSRGTTKEGTLTTTVLPSIEFAHVAIAPHFIWTMMTLPRRSLLHLHLSHAFFPEVMYFFAKLRGMKYVVHFHLDVGPSGVFGRLFLIYKAIVWGPLLRGADHIVACANDQIAIMETKFGVDRRDITVIPNAVSDDFFVERNYTPPSDKLRLLSIGRLAAQKRVERIIEACANLTIPFELTVVGDGEDKSKLEQLARDRALTAVTFVGKKNDKEMQEYARSHDAFIISSDREGMPLVVLEVMAAGLPVISTKVEGLTELLEGTGVLVEEPYAENFARTIEGLWNDPTLLKELSKKSTAKAKLYGWRSFITALTHVYKEKV